MHYITLLVVLVATILAGLATAHDTVPVPDWATKAPTAGAYRRALDSQELAFNDLHGQLQTMKRAVEQKMATLRRDNKAVALLGNETCGPCQDLINYGLRVFNASKSRDEAEAAILLTCKKVFSKHVDEQLICEILPNVLIFVAELTHNRFGFPIDKIVCSDFLHLCSYPCCAAGQKPEQLHISFANSAASGNNTSIMATWMTLDKYNAATSAPTVWWRIANSGAPFQMSSRAGSFSRTYDWGGFSGFSNSATMTNLKPATAYEYYVGAPGSPKSERHTFSTLPENVGSDSSNPLKLFVVADLGGEANGRPTLQQAHKAVLDSADDDKPHLFVCVGDWGYADGSERFWNVWGRMIEPWASSVPIAVVGGNHEVVDIFGRNGTSFYTRYPVNAPVPESSVDNYNGFFSLDAGPLTMVFVNSESAFNTPRVGQQQLNWLHKVLPAARAKGQLIFSNHHRPMYCDEDTRHFTSQCDGFAKFLRDDLEALYNKNRVALVLSGHLHNYQRTYPVLDGQVVAHNYNNISAPAYVVNGAAGCREGTDGWASNHTDTWSAFRTSRRSFMRFLVYRETGFFGNSNVVRADAKLIHSVSGATIDSFNITQMV